MTKEELSKYYYLKQEIKQIEDTKYGNMEIYRIIYKWENC